MANAVRALSIDAIEKAKSGHPGMPMGMADIAVALWLKHLRHNPENPKWPGRDRFILSNGHGSMLQYALLHLTGYDLSIEDIKAFRQFKSRTPGHPEYRVVPGVETTTGPLGQGIANAVGMALAEKMLAAEFNRDGFPVVDNRTYVFLGDGCMMEGISHEACSLAGVWKLNKLIAVYDDNGISIDGDVKNWFADDNRKRFEAYGWNVIGPIDGHNIEAVDKALSEAEASADKPTLIIAKTVIGKGSPHLAGTAKCHGAALGAEEVAATRANIGWTYPPFEVPKAIYEAMDARESGRSRQAAYDAMFAEYEKAYPQLASELKRRLAGQLPANFDQTVFEALCQAQQDSESLATRKASQKALNVLAPALPELFGGSADLTGSNLTAWKGVVPLMPDNPMGRHASFGVREFAMAAIGNGIALYGGFIPFSGTFLTFSDYERNAVRMASLMDLRNIFVFTHDSLGVGEDGPTHQPVEHEAQIRLMEHLKNHRGERSMLVLRPADGEETVTAWKLAIEEHRPVALILSRQNIKNLPALNHSRREEAAQLSKGAYIVVDAAKPAVVMLASGSEVATLVEGAELLSKEGIAVRIVSVPSEGLFRDQPKSYQQTVLPQGVVRYGLTSGLPVTLLGLVGENGMIHGLDHFGYSAPYKVLDEKFGYNGQTVYEEVKKLIGK